MPRRRKPPRLYLRSRKGRDEFWVIRDGSAEVSTGCHRDDAQGAEDAFRKYLGEKHQAPGSLPPEQLYVDEVMATYLKDYAEFAPSRDWLFLMATPITEWWAGKTLAEITGTNCQKYVRWRTGQRRKLPKLKKAPPPGAPPPPPQPLISDQTARHELKTLRTAINWYHSEHPLPSVPKVILPEKSPPKDDYWLTRAQVAARIKAARKHPYRRHYIRLLLIGVYTGTRPGTIRSLKWIPSTTGGWFDLSSQTLHRRGIRARRSKKRQPPARIHVRLLPHLKRWRAADLAAGITDVIHYQGAPIKKFRTGWRGIAVDAGDTREDGPHIMRHTAATWQMQSGTPPAEAAGYLGMSLETLWEVYGHHHPAYQPVASTATGRRMPVERPTNIRGVSGAKRSGGDAK
jgi:integrase